MFRNYRKLKDYMDFEEQQKKKDFFNIPGSTAVLFNIG